MPGRHRARVWADDWRRWSRPPPATPTQPLCADDEAYHTQPGVKGLAEIARGASSLSLPAMKQQILDDVAAWRKGPAADDMSLILLAVS